MYGSSAASAASDSAAVPSSTDVAAGDEDGYEEIESTDKAVFGFKGCSFRCETNIHLTCSRVYSSADE